MITPDKNTGVIIEEPRVGDYIQDGVSAIPYEVVNPSGNWIPYKTADEMQCGLYGDTFACVSFSHLNCLEISLNQKGISKNFSDRFLAKMSGTTHEGNLLTKVADSARNDGLVDESDWGWDPRGSNPMFTWEEFYKEIPQDIKQKGIDSKKLFSVRSEWVSTDIESLKKALKQSPLQIVTKVCGGWNTPPVAGCGLGSQHATTLLNIDDEGFHIFDHYDPYVKLLKPDYSIAYAMKHVITPLVAPKPMLEKGKNKLVRGNFTTPGGGGYGLNLGDVILDSSTERGALLAMDILMRNGLGVQLTEEEWNSVPHRPF